MAMWLQRGKDLLLGNKPGGFFLTRVQQCQIAQVWPTWLPRPGIDIAHSTSQLHFILMWTFGELFRMGHNLRIH